MLLVAKLTLWLPLLCLQTLGLWPTSPTETPGQDEVLEVTPTI